MNSYKSLDVALIPLLGSSGRENRFFASRKPRVTQSHGSRAKIRKQNYRKTFFLYEFVKTLDLH